MQKKSRFQSGSEGGTVAAGNGSVTVWSVDESVFLSDEDFEQHEMHTVSQKLPSRNFSLN